MKWRLASFSGLELKLTLPPSLTLSYYFLFLPGRPSPFFLSVSARRTRNFCNPLSRRPASSYLLCIIGRTAEKRGRKLVKPLSSIPPSFWSAAGLPILSYFGTNIMLISHRAPAVSRDTRGCKRSPCCVATLWIISFRKAGCARVKKLLNDYHWRLVGWKFFLFLFWMATVERSFRFNSLGIW